MKGGVKTSCTRPLAVCCIALQLLVSACGGGRPDERKEIVSVSPNVAVFGVPTQFTLSGKHLPTEGNVTIADGYCESPTTRTQFAISVVCTSTVAEGQSKFLVEGVQEQGPMLMLTTDLAQPSGGVMTTSDGFASPLMAYHQVAAFEKTECVFDPTTQLTWEGKTDTGLRSLNNEYTYLNDGSTDDVEAYVEAVNRSNLCGYTDWRLPTREELMSLVDYSIDTKSSSEINIRSKLRAINPEYFFNTDYTYWTSSPAVTSFPMQGRRKLFWVVDFIYGQVYVGSSSAEPQRYAVRLVRP